MSYKEIRISSNQKCDYVVAQRGELALPNSLTYEPSWANNVDFMCLFNGNLNAGNNITLPDPDKITIYKRKGGESYIHKVGTVGFGETSFRDYNVKNDSEYYYQIYAEYDDTEGVTPFKTLTIHTEWDDWFLLSGDVEQVDIYGKEGTVIETQNQLIIDKVFRFELDANGDSLNANISAQMINNFTRYPKYQKAKQNFYTGTLSALLGYEDSSGQYYDSVAMLEELRECVTDGKRKFIKDLRGHLWEVALTSFNASTRSAYIQNPYDVQIGFTEIGNVDDLIMKGVS